MSESKDRISEIAIWHIGGKPMRSLSDDPSIREAVLRLWQERTSSAIIMRVLNIGEQELELIIPKSLWFYSEWRRCRICDGEGGRSVLIPAPNDGPEIEIATEPPK